MQSCLSFCGEPFMWESESLISAREHYLSQPEVQGFTDFLAQFIVGRVFDPPYLTQTKRPKAQYCFTSLQDAWEQYIQEEPNRAFQERLIEYEKSLKEALDKRDDAAFINIVNTIFGATSLLYHSNEKTLLEMKDLCESVAFAVNQLSSDSPNEDAFGRFYGPRMTSFFSRIYATLIPDFLAYESRVAGGLCYLIRLYCIEREISLPLTLKLGCVHGWGKDKKNVSRNASWDDNDFTSLDTIKKRPLRERTFAHSNYLATWLVVEALCKAKAMDEKGSSWITGSHPIRKVEASLYMLGAELPPVD